MLLADDHEAVRHMLRLRLQASGCEIVGEAANGAEAVDLAKTQQPDLIVMDVMMPVMDGIEATRQIKEAHPEMPVIGYSAAAHAESVKALMDAGAEANYFKDNFRGLIDEITRRLPLPGDE